MAKATMQAQDAAGKATGSAKDVAGDVQVKVDRPSALCMCALSGPHLCTAPRCVQNRILRIHEGKIEV